MKGRIGLFDIVRSLCVLEIVGFWHMLDYINCNNTIIRDYGNGLTCSVLACFTFISGFFLGKKEINAKSFYWSRLTRFFIPLLLTSLILSIGGWFKSIGQFISTLTGISCFFPPQPKTLWYFSMIIIFYALTPILLYNAINKTSRVLLRGLLPLFFFICMLHLQHLDERVLIYYPFYLIGIVTKQKNLKYINNYAAIFILILWIMIIMYDLNNNIIMTFVLSALGIYLLFTISKNIELLFPKANKIFSILSYASMFAYLFHREVYLVFEIIFIKFLHFKSLPIMVVPIMLLSLFIAAYYGQKLYDNFISNFLSKKTI